MWYNQDKILLERRGFAMWSSAILEEKQQIINRLKHSNFDLELYHYLVHAKPIQSRNQLYFLNLKFVDVTEQDTQHVLALISEVIGEVVVIELKDSIVMFYFYELDFSLEEVFNSIRDDFSIHLFTFVSGKINVENPDAFFLIYYYVKHNLLFKSFANNRDLILEVARENAEQLKGLRSAILNKVEADQQLIHLIYMMFEQNLNVTQTAKSSYMHRNTMNNKLELIKKETSLNIQNFNDAIAMYLLLKSK